MSLELSPKHIKYDREMLDRLEEGIKEVHDAVGRTMGPEGQLVMYEESNDNPYVTVTKDGVSVASMIVFKDQDKNMGAQFVIQAARKQVEETGDGTTLTSVLTYKLFKEGRKLIDTGYSPNQIIKGMKSGVDRVVEALKVQAVTDVTMENLIDIATVSVNHDRKLAEKIGEAVYKTGKYGMVVHDIAFQEDHEVEYQEGYQLDIGVIHPEFMNNQGKGMSLSNPYILVTDHNIVNAEKLAPILEQIISNEPDKKPFLIIVSPQIGNEVLQVMKRNITDAENGKFFGVHIMPSKDYRPEKNKSILQDIAAISGGRFFSQDSGYKPEKATINDLGRVKHVNSVPSKTLFMGYDSANDTLLKRLVYLEEIIKNSGDKLLEEYAKESIAKLTGGVATIKVGGKNLTEQIEVRHRVDDAIKACKSAQEMGYVRGGGVALIHAARLDIHRESHLPPGLKVVIDSLDYPARTILNNAKNEWTQTIIKELKHGAKGYDVYNGVEPGDDMFERKIIDPLKVVIYALKNASSSAISMLQTSVMITIDKEDRDDS